MHRGILLEMPALRSPCGLLSRRLQTRRMRLFDAWVILAGPLPPVGECDESGLFRRVAV
jgi:hypothetical protein